MKQILGLTFIILHLNIMFPLKPTSSTWSFCFRFPHKNPTCMFLIPHVCHATFISSYFIILVLPGKRTNRKYFHCAILSSFVLLPLLKTKVYLLPPNRANMFHTHTKCKIIVRICNHRISKGMSVNFVCVNTEYPQAQRANETTKNSGSNSTRHSPNLNCSWFLHISIPICLYSQQIYGLGHSFKELIRHHLVLFCPAFC